VTLKITILCVGTLKEAYWREATTEYAKRLRRFASVDVVEVQEKRLPANASTSDERFVIEEESRMLAAKIFRSARTLVVALDVSGTSMSSPALASWMSEQTASGKTELIFIIGGSLGLSDELLGQADIRLSFSLMTFPHQMMRVILLEQIYRAMKI